MKEKVVIVTIGLCLVSWLRWQTACHNAHALWVMWQLSDTAVSETPICESEGSYLARLTYEPDEILAEWEQQKESQQLRPEDWYLYGAVLAEIGDEEAKYEAWRHIPNYADGFVRRGRNLLESDPDTALILFEEAVLIDPQHGEAWGQVGQLRYQLAELAGAETAVLEALKWYEDPILQFTLAKIYRDQSQSELAIDNFESFLRIHEENDPLVYWAHVNLGFLYQISGENEPEMLALAVTHYETAVSLHPDRIEPYFPLINSYRGLEDEAMAITMLAQLPAEKVQDLETAVRLTHTYLQFDQIEAANGMISHYLGTDPQATAAAFCQPLAAWRESLNACQ